MKNQIFAFIICITAFNSAAYSQCQAFFSPNYNPVCFGQSVVFTNLSDDGGLGGATYAWNFGSGATPATSTATNPGAVTYSTPGSKKITLTINSGGTFGCSSTYYGEITVTALPTVSFTSTAPQCANSAVNFTNKGSTGNLFSYQWDFGPNASPSSSTDQNPLGIVYSKGGSKKVTFTISTFGCSVTDTSSIAINSLPVAFAGNDTTICSHASIQLGTANNPAYTYKWSEVSTLNNGTVSNPIANPIAPVTSYVLSVTQTGTGCVGVDTAQVTMLPPLSALPGVSQTICQFDSTQIGAGLVTGQNYNWQPTAGLNNSHLPNPTASPSATTTYTLSVTGSGCGPITAEVKVTVHPLPTIEAGGPLDSIALGESKKLFASGGVQYVWTPFNTLNDAGIYNPVATPTTNTTYIVTGTDIYGCVNTDSVTVDVFTPSYWIPNAFTPGAPTNNVLKVHGEGISGFKFSVFNRNGERIFFTEDLYQGWDGKKQGSGETMPEGAYVCTISGTLSTGSPIHQTKMINLIR